MILGCRVAQPGGAAFVAGRFIVSSMAANGRAEHSSRTKASGPLRRRDTLPLADGRVTAVRHSRERAPRLYSHA